MNEDDGNKDEIIGVVRDVVENQAGRRNVAELTCGCFNENEN